MTFTEWFEAQHSKRPHSPLRTDEMLRQCVREGEYATAQLAEREEWDARRESALYAWQARSKP